MTTHSEIAITRKDKFLELEKQKMDLEVIYREKEGQLKVEYAAEFDKLRVERDKIRQEY